MAADRRCYATVIAVESGKPGVGIGLMMSMLAVLGLQGRLAEALQKDEVDEELESARKCAGGSTKTGLWGVGQDGPEPIQY